MPPIRILLADDHPVVRTGIRKILEKEADMQVVAEANNGEEVLQLVKQIKPDVILLDMEMPGKKGHEVVQELKKEKLAGCVLVLSAHAEKTYIQALQNAGAAGYLTKDEVPHTIVEAVRGVARGEPGWISRKVAAQLTDMINDDRPKDTDLTVREMEVLEGVASAKTTREIAYNLGISEKTVEKHLESIFTKLGINSRVEAAVMAVRKGWVK
jgi:DNA-binding NarL/FixJ family response regulator